MPHVFKKTRRPSMKLHRMKNVYSLHRKRTKSCLWTWSPDRVSSGQTMCGVLMPNCYLNICILSRTVYYILYVTITLKKMHRSTSLLTRLDSCSVFLYWRMQLRVANQAGRCSELYVSESIRLRAEFHTSWDGRRLHGSPSQNTKPDTVWQWHRLSGCQRYFWNWSPCSHPGNDLTGNNAGIEK